jgi:hypothetical protein
MRTIFLLSLSLLAFVSCAFGQGPCINKKVISPASPKPTEPDVSATCSTFTVQWKGQANQSFVLTAIEKNALTNEVIDTIVSNTTANSATIKVKTGMAIRWQVEAITVIDSRSFYSYPLRGGKDYIIPDCTTPIAAARQNPLSLKVSGASGDAKNKVRIYPNPFQSSLNIQFAGIKSSHKIISIFDVNGRMISTQRTTKNLTKVNLKQLTGGTYFIRIQDETGKVFYNGEVVKE